MTIRAISAQPITVNETIRSLISRNAVQLKASHKVTAIRTLNSLRGSYLAGGAETEAYTVAGYSDLVMLVTQAGRYPAESHAIKALQLAIAGQLFGHAYDSRRLSIIVTQHTLDLCEYYQRIEHRKYRGQATQDDLSRWWAYYMVFPHITELVRVKDSRNSSRQVWNVRDGLAEAEAGIISDNAQFAGVGEKPYYLEAYRLAAKLVLRFLTAADKLPTIGSILSHKRLDLHGGNWRVNSDGEPYLADAVYIS